MRRSIGRAAGFATGVFLCALAAGFPVLTPGSAAAQDRALSGRAKALDADGDGVIGRDEARGPLSDNFAEMDCDRSGTLDGGEIRGFFTGTGCGASAAPAAPAAAPAAGSGPPAGRRPARPVRVDEVIVAAQSQTAPVLGRLVARRSGRVAALVSGAVVRIDVEVGDRVRRGDIVATLSGATLEALRDKFGAALATRRALLAAAEAESLKKDRELQRMKELRQSSSFSRARFEDLERDVQQRRAMIDERRARVREGEADLRRAEIDLRNSRIRAPYDGVVAARHAEVGAYVGLGAPVVTLINDGEIEIEAEVPSDRIAGLVPGIRVRLQLDDGTWGRAAVRALVPEENPRTRTRPVRFVPEFGAGVGRLAVNQSVTVMVPVGEIRQAVTVHKDAIVRQGDRQTVYIARNGKAFPRRVALGDAVGNRYVVLSGLKAGDRVITYGNEGLPPGAVVRVIANRLEPVPVR